MKNSEKDVAAECERRATLWRLCADTLSSQIVVVARMITHALQRGGKVLIFGNGGSAAEAQHFAAELVGRFERDRRALAAIALTTDTSILTSQANDAGFSHVFSRQIEALAKPGDIVIGLTTSDVSPNHSENIREGFQAAHRHRCTSIGLFSEKTSELLPMVTMSLIVPERNTALIQEVHLGIIHTISRLVEQEVS